MMSQFYKVIPRWFDTLGVNNRTNNTNIDPSAVNKEAATFLGLMELKFDDDCDTCTAVQVRWHGLLGKYMCIGSQSTQAQNSTT